jgi:hypothetical protein
MNRTLALICILILGMTAWGQTQLRAFRIRFVTSDVVYLEGGSAAGLREGMRLYVKRPRAGESALLAPAVAELAVISVASSSSACEIVKADVSVAVGDEAFIASEDLAAQTSASSENQTFAQIVEFTEEESLEAELRESVPKPPLREVNRFSGRVGFDEDVVLDRSVTGRNFYQHGVAFRFDFTRIGDSYWTLDGYWRLRINSRNRPVEQQTITEVLQRVYHFGIRYNNPQSRYVLGFGRVMVPWANSLSTLDGGYIGARLGRTVTAGAFAGTTPDPTAWNYDPHRQLGGVFVNVDRGSFENSRYSVTGGVAISRLDWKPERQFLFAETSLYVGPKVSFHHNIEVDYRSKDRFASSSPISLTRSFASVRVRPLARVSLDLNHNYFRVLPTPDERLLATGRLDNLLFQGFHGGGQVQLPYGLSADASAGRSSRSDDGSASWNFTTGLSGRIPNVGVRAQARYSRFTGVIGAGQYRSISVRRDNSERWHLELEVGDQHFDSPMSPNSRSWYTTGNADIFIGQFVLGFRGTRYRGSLQNYDQLRAGLDFRF